MSVSERISRIARPIVMLAALGGPIAYGGVKAYSMLQPRTVNAPSSSREYFNDFIHDFKVRPSGDSIVIIEKQGELEGYGTSEGLSYARLLGQVHGDLKLVSEIDHSLEMLQEANGKVLPPWKFLSVPSNDPLKLRLTIPEDKDATSAMDANMDIATSMIWSYHDKHHDGPLQHHVNQRDAEKIQRFLNLIWPAMNYNGQAAIPGLYETSTASPYTRIPHSASYVSLFELELFNAADAEESHEWMNVARAAMKIREAILEKHTYREIPDFVQVVFERDPGNKANKPRYVIIETGDPRFPSQMGFNGIRTFWRIGLDCVMLKDAGLKKDNIILARKIVYALGGDPINTIKGTKLYDEKGKSGPEKEIALAAYTALAYGASQPIGNNDGHYLAFYNNLHAELLKEMRSENFKTSIKDKYYQRATVAITLAVIDQSFSFQPKAFEVARVAEGRSKQLQSICDDNYGWPFTRGSELILTVENGAPMLHKNFKGIYGDKDSLKRLMLLIRNELDWLQECDTKRCDLGQPRTESVERQNEYRMQTASNLTGALMFNGAVWMYAQVLEKADPEKEKATVVKAANGLNDSLEAGKYSPIQKAALYSALLEKRKDNPYIALGLAKAYADTFVSSGFDEAEKIALKLVETLPTRAYKLLAEIYLRRAQYDHKLSNRAGEALNYDKALNAITMALIAKNNIDPELVMGLYLLKGDIEQNHFKFSKNRALIASAESSFSHVYSHPKASADQRLKALLGLSRCVREKPMDKDKLSQIEKDELKRFIEEKINRELEVKRPETYAASYLQLMVERIRIYSQLKDQDSVGKSFSKALSFAPRGRLRVYFEQIGYFIRKGEYAKARYRSEQLAAFSDEINGAKTPNDIRQGLIDENAIVQLKQIEKDIRSEYLPNIANREMTTEQAKKKIQEKMAEIPDASGIQEVIKDKLAKNDKLESIADAIESTEEINVLRRELANKTDIRRQARILMQAKAIAAAPFDKMLDASEKAATACAAELNERPYDPGFFEAMLELFNAAAWTIDKQDNHMHRSDATALLEEILNQKYAAATAASSPLFPYVLGVLRDKEIRGGINALMDSREEKREEFASTLGEIYGYAQKFGDSIEAYRRSLGLAPKPSKIANEYGELLEVVQSRPEALATIRKMTGMAHYDDENRAHLLNAIVFGNVLGYYVEIPKSPELLNYCNAHQDKYFFDDTLGMLRVNGEMSDTEKIELQGLYPKQKEKDAVNTLYERSHTSALDASQMMQLVVLNAGNYVPNRKPNSFDDDFRVLLNLFNGSPQLRIDPVYKQTLLKTAIRYLESIDRDPEPDPEKADPAEVARVTEEKLFFLEQRIRILVSLGRRRKEQLGNRLAYLAVPESNPSDIGSLTLAVGLSENELDTTLKSDPMNYREETMHFRLAEIYKALGQKYETTAQKLEKKELSKGKKEPYARQARRLLNLAEGEKVNNEDLLKQANHWYELATAEFGMALQRKENCSNDDKPFNHCPFAVIANFEANIARWTTGDKPNDPSRELNDLIKKNLFDNLDLIKRTIVGFDTSDEKNDNYQRVLFFTAKAYAKAGRWTNNPEYFAIAKALLQILNGDVSGKASDFPGAVTSLHIDGLNPQAPKGKYGDLSKWIKYLKPETAGQLGDIF